MTWVRSNEQCAQPTRGCRVGQEGKAPPQSPRGLEVPGDIELRDGATLVERVLDALWVGGVTGDVRRNTGASHHLDRVRELVGERPGELERPHVEIPAEAVVAPDIAQLV